MLVPYSDCSSNRKTADFTSLAHGFKSTEQGSAADRSYPGVIACRGTGTKVMNNLIYQRCFNHQTREAVARCPGCGRFFCRECITEYEDRVLCATCLASISASQSTAFKPFKIIRIVFQCGLGVITAWLFFYYLGRILLTLPDAFHNGTLWQSPWWMK
jgi:hypothetical protein